MAENANFSGLIYNKLLVFRITTEGTIINKLVDILVFTYNPLILENLDLN